VTDPVTDPAAASAADPDGQRRQDGTDSPARDRQDSLLSDARAVRRAFCRTVAADLRLAQSELAAARTSAVRGAALLALALALLLAGLVALVGAIVLGLNAAGMPPAVAALVAALAFLGAAALSVWLARRHLSSRRLWPSQTIAALSRLPESLAATHPRKENSHA